MSSSYNEYADNTVTEKVDESQIDIALSWKKLEPKFKPGEIVAAAEAGEGREIVFYNRDTERICQVKKVTGKRGKFHFQDIDADADKQHVYFGSKESIKAFFHLKNV